MAHALLPQRLFDGHRILEHRAVIVDGARISDVCIAAALPDGLERRELPGLLAPGFIDVQVNGGGGVLFNDERTVEGIAAIGRAHRPFGTTGFMVTFITDERQPMAEAIAATGAALEAGLPGLLGIHVEGPFLNPARKGVHNPAFMRPLEPADVALLTSLRAGRTLVTLAPERVDHDLIAELVRHGVLVSAGHTAADHHVLRAALSRGLSGFTHLFNAMPPMAGREPGPVGVAMSGHGCFSGLIVDGYHVDEVSMRAAVRAIGTEHVMLVTDAMPGVGSASPNFILQGREVRRENGRCTLVADGTLAGSDLDMAGAVRNTVRWLDLPLPAALRMASAVPARFLRLDDELGRIAPGFRADLVLLDEDLEVRGTWIGGDFEAA